MFESSSGSGFVCGLGSGSAETWLECITNSSWRNNLRVKYLTVIMLMVVMVVLMVVMVVI